MIVEIIPPITLLTALGVWYGYELTLARARYFGLDPSVLDFTTRDLLLRTAPAVLAPLLYLTLVLIGLIWLHAVMRWLLGHSLWTRGIQVVGVSAAVVGVLLVVLGLRVVGDRNVLDEFRTLRPMVLPVGIVLVTYSLWLVINTLATPGRKWRSLPRGAVGGVVGLVLLCLFWSFSMAAENAGARDSYRLYAGALGELPRVVVYSDKELAFNAPGVEAVRIGGSEVLYHWRYQGLRLLVHSAGKYFLLPSKWASRDHPAILLSDGPGLRFEFQESEGYVP